MLLTAPEIHNTPPKWVSRNSVSALFRAPSQYIWLWNNTWEGKHLFALSGGYCTLLPYIQFYKPYLMVRGGLAIESTGRIPAGLAANLACPTFIILLLLLLFFFLYCCCFCCLPNVLKWSFPNSPFNNKTLIYHESVSLGWQCDSPRARSAHPRVRQKDARLENGVEARGAERLNCPVQVFKCRSVTSVHRLL